MLLIVFLTLVIGAHSALSSGSKSSECYAVKNYYGSEFDANQRQQLVGPPGLPGKKGVHGDTGFPGEEGIRGPAGDKGERGEIPPAILEELFNMKVRLQEIELLLPKFNKTCAHIYDDTMESGYYLISPNPAGVKPFYVYCNFTSTGAYTVFGHDSEREIPVTKCHQPRCYSHNINYNYNMKQMREVVLQSRNCRQYIKYRCQGSVFNWPNTSPYAGWRTYDGEDRYNWGGSNERYVCECGITGTCLNPKQKCNCDQNDESVVTSDEGYLDEKMYLPVTNLKFGDTDGENEAGWHTLGRLECSGTAN